jgi:hypothetical protein
MIIPWGTGLSSSVNMSEAKTNAGSFSGKEDVQV